MFVSRQDLIFDIGLHKGLDSEFYLNKGFSVVGLEASPDLWDHVRAALEPHVSSGKLCVVQKALFHEDDKEVTFFINPDKDDWGSLEQGSAEKGVGHSVSITVPTVTLATLFKTYGVPYYLKCDIEGGDAILAEQLLNSAGRPTFVSLEATSADDIAKLVACGYDRFQLVNQYLNIFVECPEPAREGVYVNSRFSHETSGLFGKELPPEKWTDFSKTMAMFLDWYSLRERDANLAVGWLDVHACKSETLTRGV